MTAGLTGFGREPIPVLRSARATLAHLLPADADLDVDNEPALCGERPARGRYWTAGPRAGRAKVCDLCQARLPG